MDLHTKKQNYLQMVFPLKLTSDFSQQQHRKLKKKTNEARFSKNLKEIYKNFILKEAIKSQDSFKSILTQKLLHLMSIPYAITVPEDKFIPTKGILRNLQQKDKIRTAISFYTLL